MKLSGLCDLHCHYLPSVDDGVRSLDDARLLCQRLAELGYSTVVATPHMRSGMFDNDKPQLSAAFAALREALAGETGLPELGLGAEHFVDERFMARLGQGETLPYPGGHALLVEFPAEHWPLGLAECLFRVRLCGLRPVIAHPERYAPLWQSSEPVAPLIEQGALGLLDTMSLVGKYGRKPKQAAERMLKEELYFAACSDSHRPADVDVLAQAIARLCDLCGTERAQALLGEHPRQILAGEVLD